jgi:hypothetical protein
MCICIFQKSSKIYKGQLSILETDQNKIGEVINQLKLSGIGEHIYCVLCGRINLDQKKIVRERSRIDTQLFIDFMTWFVQESGHPVFKDTSIPEQ